MNILALLKVKPEPKTEAVSLRLTKKNMDFLNELCITHGNSKNDILNTLIKYCREEYKKDESEWKMSYYLDRQMELLQEEQEKINTKKQLLEFLITKEKSENKACFEFYSSTFHYFREILIRESVKTIEFLSLTLKIKEQYKKSGYSDYENYLRNYPYRCVNQIIKNIRNNELGGN